LKLVILIYEKAEQMETKQYIALSHTYSVKERLSKVYKEASPYKDSLG